MKLLFFHPAAVRLADVLPGGRRWALVLRFREDGCRRDVVIAAFREGKDARRAVKAERRWLRSRSGLLRVICGGAAGRLGPFGV